MTLTLTPQTVAQARQAFDAMLATYVARSIYADEIAAIERFLEAAKRRAAADARPAAAQPDESHAA